MKMTNSISKRGKEQEEANKRKQQGRECQREKTKNHACNT
jgi:hypothetical protein